MAQAKDIGQVVALEGELSQREGDLESLESQLGALKNGVARSTLTVWLSTPDNESVTSSGFVAGLRSGGTHSRHLPVGSSAPSERFCPSPCSSP
jgi:Domain of unknown function (DUF4349)